MNALDTVVAYNRAGRVGSSSIYCAGVAERMVAVSQAQVANYLHHRAVGPAAIISINNRIEEEYEVYKRR